ncbi:kinase-like domain-containing protein [Achaetomium macrosporum]|uniref:Kinase-like domain-containing protein n=1 Tax=Achaetomium macrosporum TaxID=79813 RepID=A0AAN7C5Q1_9PEZI|nr:kinase-like domain-containing protein [Achaetomium macrosporum]
MKDILIAGRYRVDRKIGQGGFGLVYSGTDLQSGEEVAIKLEYMGNGRESLKWEQSVYEELSGGVGIPRVRFSGSEGEYYVLVYDILGPSLEDLFNYCGRRFSLKTILLIADQTISRLQYIHSKGWLHRDIKPDHFLSGTGRQGNTLYTIDFGLATDFDPAHGQSLKCRPHQGTTLFASLNNHRGHQQSWGEDLESLGYAFVYFASGSLPWQDVDAHGSKEMVKELKEELSGEKLREAILPPEFATYIDHTRTLGFGNRPDYSYLRRLFRRLFVRKGFKHDNVFDWTEKRFHQLRQSTVNQSVSSTEETPQRHASKPRRSGRNVRKGGHGAAASAKAVTDARPHADHRVVKRSRCAARKKPM